MYGENCVGDIEKILNIEYFLYDNNCDAIFPGLADIALEAATSCLPQSRRTLLAGYLPDCQLILDGYLPYLK